MASLGLDRGGMAWAGRLGRHGRRLRAGGLSFCPLSPLSAPPQGAVEASLWVLWCPGKVRLTQYRMDWTTHGTQYHTRIPEGR